MFTDLSGQPTSLERFLQDHVNGNPVIYIGTDSKTIKQTKFSTVLVSYTPGRGGVILRRTRRERKIESLQERLWKEAWYSVQLALDVAERMQRPIEIQIHLDVNASDLHHSSKYAPALIGLVTSQGFSCRIKPEAWCATCIADRLVRNP